MLIKKMKERTNQEGKKWDDKRYKEKRTNEKIEEMTARKGKDINIHHSKNTHTKKRKRRSKRRNEIRSRKTKRHLKREKKNQQRTDRHTPPSKRKYLSRTCSHKVFSTGPVLFIGLQQYVQGELKAKMSRQDIFLRPIWILM